MIGFLQVSALSTLRQLNALYAEISRLKVAVALLKKQQNSFEGEIVFLKALCSMAGVEFEQKINVLIGDVLVLH